jgi:hypothetical protein
MLAGRAAPPPRPAIETQPDEWEVPVACARFGNALAVTCVVRTMILALAVASAVHAQNFGVPVDQVLRVQWEVPEFSARGPVVTGYVVNTSSNRVGLVRLRAEVLDDGGRVVADGTGWVYGDISPGGRGYFIVPIPRRGVAYRVAVTSFSWQAEGR